MPDVLDYLRDYLQQDRRVIPPTASVRAATEAAMADPDQQALEIKLRHVEKPNIYPDPLPTSDPTSAMEWHERFPGVPTEQWITPLQPQSDAERLRHAMVTALLMKQP